MNTPERWTTCRHHGGSWFEGGRLPPYCASSPDSCDRVSYVLESVLEAALVEARTQAARATREEIAAHIESRIAPYAGTKIPGPTYWINEKLRELAEWVRSGGPDA